MNVKGARMQLKKMLNNSLQKKFDKFFLYIFQRNVSICFSIIAIIFLFDRFSKIKVINQIDDSTIYINDFVNFDLIWNTGIGFGLLSSDLSLFYNLITIIIGLVIVFLFYLLIKSDLIDQILFSTILGGALGNFYDRITYNAVPDFIDVHYENFHWFTFNIADIFISLGIAIILLKDLFLKNEKN